MRGGFTLIELVLVTSLFSVLVLLAVPRFRGTFSALALEQGAHSLALTMQYARARAIIEGRPCRVTLEPEQGTYWLSCKDAGVFRRVSGRLGQLRRVPRGVRLEGRDQRHVLFLPNGTRGEARIRLSIENGAWLRVAVDDLTGVAVEEPPAQ